MPKLSDSASQLIKLIIKLSSIIIPNLIRGKQFAFNPLRLAISQNSMLAIQR